MGYAEDLLASNERIVYTSRRHWIAPLFSSVTGTVLTAAGIVGIFWQIPVKGFLGNVILWSSLGSLLVGASFLAHAFVDWWSEYYFVTNQKVMKVAGVIKKTADGSALEKINDITIEQSLLGRSLSYGTLRVLTASDESNLSYLTMREPMEFRKHVLDQKQLFEQNDARAIAEAVRASLPQPVPVTPPAETTGIVAAGSFSTPLHLPTGASLAVTADEVATAIERLAQMREAGHITLREFETKKTELLNRL
jgi:uncharacterized membrane protein YdbT with pleckstrin-like domain